MLRIQTRTHRKRDKGVKVKNARESNTDCHFVVDEEGMVTTTLAGQVLTSARPSSGVVTDSQYVYYTVRADMSVTRRCAPNPYGLCKAGEYILLHLSVPMTSQ